MYIPYLRKPPWGCSGVRSISESEFLGSSPVRIPSQNSKDLGIPPLRIGEPAWGKNPPKSRLLLRDLTAYPGACRPHQNYYNEDDYNSNELRRKPTTYRQQLEELPEEPRRAACRNLVVAVFKRGGRILFIEILLARIARLYLLSDSNKSKKSKSAWWGLPTVSSPFRVLMAS